MPRSLLRGFLLVAAKTKEKLSATYIEKSERCFFRPFRDKFKNCIVSEVSPAQAQKYIDGHAKWNEVTRNTHVRHLRTCYSFLIGTGHATINPFLTINFAKVAGGKLRAKVLSVDDTEKLLQYAFDSGDKAGLRFVENGIIAALLQARDRELQKIIKQGGAVDCYDKLILVDRDREPRQILAELAQAVEMKLIAPIFRLAEFNDNFKIMLYQFDGVSIHSGKKEGITWQEEKGNHFMRLIAQDLNKRLYWR